MPPIPPEGTTPNGDPEQLLKRHLREGEAIFKGWSRELLTAVEDLGTAGEIQQALATAGERLSPRPLASSLERQDLRAQMLGAADADWEAANLAIVEPAAFARAGHWQPIACELPGFTQKPFGTAVADFLRKQIVSQDVFKRMTGEARRRAFTVAGAAKQVMLQEVFGELAAALQAGEDLRQFRARLEQALSLKGWLRPSKRKVPTVPGSPSHVELIYRNNIHGSYARGRDEQQRQPAVVAVMPYWQVVTLRADGKSRKTHAAAHGKILRWDDPFWTRAPLPWGHRCLTPGSLVQGRFLGGSRAWYQGPVVTVTTRGGRVLRVTARHPVRRHDAMVPAGKLRPGDRVLCYPDSRGEPAEALFQRLLGDDEPVVTVPRPEDFHGEAARFAGAELTGSYARAALGAGNARRRAPSHDAKDHRVGPGDELISGMAGNLRLPAQLQAADPFELDEVTSVEASDYGGYVYDFETATGWLVADGVVTSNCRCRKVARTAAQVERRGLTVSTGADMPRLPDPGWG